MIMVPLTAGLIALIDDADAELVIAHTWHRVKGRRTWYAATNVRSAGGARTTVLMHRLVTNAKEAEEVDHADRDGLNNQRGNLRIATASQNKANGKAPRNNRTGYRGVHFYTARGNYSAYINKDHKRRHLGYFPTPEAAARAYDKAARELFGESAYQNLTP